LFLSKENFCAADAYNTCNITRQIHTTSFERRMLHHPTEKRHVTWWARVKLSSPGRRTSYNQTYVLPQWCLSWLSLLPRNSCPKKTNTCHITRHAHILSPDKHMSYHPTHVTAHIRYVSHH